MAKANGDELARAARPARRRLGRGGGSPVVRATALLAGMATLLGTLLVVGAATPAGAQPATPLSVATGGNFSCAVLGSGSLTCWGNNSAQQAMPPAGNDYLSVLAGAEFACAQKTDDTLACWGDNSFDQVSDVPSGVAFSSYATGDAFACGIRKDNSQLMCWGRNDSSQATPPSGTFTAVDADDNFACAIATGGSVDCWGAGGGPTPPKSLTNAATIAVGLDAACSTTTSNQLVCWGASPAVTAAPKTGSFEGVAVGGTNFGCAVTTAGAMDCFPSTAGPQAAPPALPPAASWTANVTAGDQTACDTATNGWAYCWGTGSSDDLGAPPSISTTSLPDAVRGIAYSQQISTSATPAVTSFAVTGSLPPGLSLDAATGVISGTPAASGNGHTYGFTVTASDGVFAPATEQLAITVTPQLEIGFQTLSSHSLLAGSSPNGSQWTPAASGQSTQQTSKAGPAIAAFNASLYEAFIANGSRPQILVSSSSDGVHWGTRWAGTAQYTPGPPAMAVFHNQLWVAFVSDDASHRLLIIHSSDGTHWSGYASTGQTSALTPSLAAFGSRLYMAFTASNHDLMVMSSSDGQHWGGLVKTGQTTSRGPGLGVVGSSLVAPFVTNSSPYHVWVIHSTNGTSWSTYSRTTIPSIRRPVVTSLNGEQVIAATNSSGGRILVSESSNGTSWGPALNTPYFSSWGPAATSF